MGNLYMHCHHQNVFLKIFKVLLLTFSQVKSGESLTVVAVVMYIPFSHMGFFFLHMNADV